MTMCKSKTVIIKAVIFDLDGTITKPYLDFDAIREEIGLERNSGPILEAMETMTEQQRLKAQKILDYHEQKALEESELNPGSSETLEELRSSGIYIGVLTRNKKQNAYAIAEKYNLQFDAVVGREDGPVKPNAFGVIHLCKMFGVEPQQTLLVGDYLFDMMCAKQAGAIGVLLINHKQACRFMDSADFCINKISEVLDIIKKQNCY